MNIQYVEYDRDWGFENETVIQHFELYDVEADPYQLKNIYPDYDEKLKEALHAELQMKYECEGSGCSNF